MRKPSARGKTALTDSQQVSAYIAAAPVPARAMLRQLRSVIRTGAPEAEEKLSYGMPYYGLHGRLIYFAAFKSHVSVFLMGRSKQQFAAETARWRTTANTMRLAFGERVPAGLLKRIVRARVKELLAEAAGKSRTKSKRVLPAARKGR